MSGLALEDKYFVGESGQILQSAAGEGRLGECLSFLRNGRSLDDWKRYLRDQKAFERAMFPRKRWSDLM